MYNVNTLRWRLNAAIFQMIFSKTFFLNEMYEFWLKSHLSFYPKGPINNISALDQVMA